MAGKTHAGLRTRAPAGGRNHPVPAPVVAENLFIRD